MGVHDLTNKMLQTFIKKHEVVIMFNKGSFASFKFKYKTNYSQTCK